MSGLVFHQCLQDFKGFRGAFYIFPIGFAHCPLAEPYTKLENFRLFRRMAGGILAGLLEAENWCPGLFFISVYRISRVSGVLFTFFL